jgi:hypothetical protein
MHDIHVTVWTRSRWLPVAAACPAARGLGRSAVAAVVTRPTSAYREPGRTRLARFELKNVNRTSQPWSIGHAASNGCIRLPNDMLRRLFAMPAGTPVIIRR